jgi:1-deoxy-D-xylulose-5-phosphate synthase
MAAARDLKGDDRNVVAIIGDGSMSAGMAYEAMNNAGAMKARLIVILNDNDMSIAPPVGRDERLSVEADLLAPLPLVREHDGASWRSASPRPIERTAARAEEFARGLLTGGHALRGARLLLCRPDRRARPGPPAADPAQPARRRGCAADPAACRDAEGQGLRAGRGLGRQVPRRAKFNVITGEQAKAPPGPPSYTKVFAQALIAEAEADERIVAINAAMPAGTGLDLFAKRFPKRCFDVGIAEQHAVTFAAGMATEGLKPFCAIYSTFLQRAYDQVVHDVVLQGLPVRFGMDRAGLVGADGATHAGSFDIAYLGCLPGIVLMAAADEVELAHMVATSAAIDDRPSAFRYPRGEGVGLPVPARGTPLEVGRGRILKEGTKVAILSYGTRLAECLKAAEELGTRGCPRRLPMRASPSRSTPRWSSAWRGSMRC